MTEYSQLYDASVPDWPGELDLYRRLTNDVIAQQGSLLEVACGTGRVAIRLAQTGVPVVGLDRSTDLLAGARAKSADLPNIRWVEGDMRSFDLGETFALIIIPGHSFQCLLTSADQMACLDTLHRHLNPGGRLVLHLDHLKMEWLGAISSTKRWQFEPTKELVHPQNRRKMQVSEAWAYDSVTQTASVRTHRVITEADGTFIERVERGPTDFHCVFPFEMEHLLLRAGYQIESVFGDFVGGALTAESTDMVWVARR